MSTHRLRFVLCWHMHQPWYRETLDGDYALPWVYLHALKDYSDMAAHLEAHPAMRAVVNFTPVLLEQLAHYAERLRAWLSHGSSIPDPLLELLAGLRPVPVDPERRQELLRCCLRAHAPRMIDPHPAFRALLVPLGYPEIPGDDLPLLDYLDDQYFIDLLVWYHLAWLGHSLRAHPTVQGLMLKARLFDLADRRALLSLFAEIIEGLPGRYRALAESGQIELSATPWSHPIVPLLLDFESAHCALPGCPLPVHPGYPGGEARAEWQLAHGLAVFERFFGRRPQGVWLSEGSVSEQAVALLARFGITWTASGEGVWHNSRRLSGLPHDTPEARHALFSPHRMPQGTTRLFFRDDGLSDRIGFEYQHWNSEDAVTDFLHHLHNIRNYLGERAGERVVSVILDGENAWEYYPDNAWHFLGELYQRLAADPLIELTTFGEAQSQVPDMELPRLCAGSWVHGSFSTWIGEPAKNRAWDLLVEAKRAYDEVLTSGRLDTHRQLEAGLQLAVCEGSDWFWWFGDDNPSDSVRAFDRLYRQQLTHLYELLGKPPPETLTQPLAHGGGQAANAGTMRRGHE